MLSNIDKQNVLKLIECYYIQAERILKRKLKRPDIDFNLSGRTSGYAKYKSDLSLLQISLNAVLLDENREYFVNQTIPHEISHIISVEVYGFYAGKGILVDGNISCKRYLILTLNGVIIWIPIQHINLKRNMYILVDARIIL